MSESTTTAAKALGVEPADLILKLKVLGADFKDCWPTVEATWIKTVAEMMDDHREQRPVGLEAELEEPLEEREIPCSQDAAHVLEKLYRNHKWGDVYVSSESAAKMANLSVADYKDAREELVDMELVLLQESKKNAVSLDPGKKAEILEVLKDFGLNFAD